MNLSELAAHLDLSVTTVSRVLAGSPEKYRISEATSKRVLEAAEKYNAAPNPLGSNLRKGQTGMIGLLVPDITNPFFAELAREIDRELRKLEKTILLFDSGEDAGLERNLLRDMTSRRLDGFIIASVGINSDELTKAATQEQNPVVLVDRLIPELNVNSVSLDNRDSGKQAVRHLIDKGHRKIGVLRGDTQTLADRERFEGIRNEMKKAGLSLEASHIAGNGYSLEAGIEGSQSILKADVKPTAVITLNGQGILALLRVAREYQLQIPEDISVVAFDDQPWSPFINPPITTIAQPVAEIAHEAVELLFNGKQKHKAVLKAEILERVSVIEVRDS